MVVRKISEMYDLRTSLGRLGVIGVHTPSTGQIARRWLGDMINHRYFRILKCNIRMACASVLPADPSQVGITAGAIAPQDIMNPILYRAVTNDTWNSLVGRLYGTSGADVDTNSLKSIPDAFSTMVDADVEDVYYSLLSSDEWRKALPQSGLSMYNLRPYVYPIYGVFGGGLAVNPNGGAGTIPNSVLGTAINGTSGSIAVAGANLNSDRVMRGPARPYPRMACTFGNLSYDETGGIINDPQPMPRSYVCAIALPPAKLQSFYFRMIIDWFVEFSDPVSILEKLDAPAQAEDGAFTYQRGYSFASSKELEGGTDISSVTTAGADLDLVMEK